MVSYNDIPRWQDIYSIEGLRLSDAADQGHPISGRFWRMETPIGGRSGPVILEIRARPCDSCGLDMVRVERAGRKGFGRGPIKCTRCKTERRRATWALRKRAQRAAKAQEVNRRATCHHCGATFTPKRSTAQFCGTACRVAAHRANKA